MSTHVTEVSGEATSEKGLGGSEVSFSSGDVGQVSAHVAVDSSEATSEEELEGSEVSSSSFELSTDMSEPKECSGAPPRCMGREAIDIQTKEEFRAEAVGVERVTIHRSASPGSGIFLNYQC